MDYMLDYGNLSMGVRKKQILNFFAKLLSKPLTRKFVFDILYQIMYHLVFCALRYDRKQVFLCAKQHKYTVFCTEEINREKAFASILNVVMGVIWR